MKLLDGMVRLLAALAASLLLVQAVSAQGVAMVLDRTGEVEVGVLAKVAKLKLLDYLPADAELRVPASGGATLVYLATSQEWQFEGPGRYRLAPGQPTVLEGKPPQARGLPPASSQALAKLEPVQRERMALGAMVMRSAALLRTLGPKDADVLDARPTLMWQSTSEAPVRVSVYRAGSNVALAQAVTQDTQWRPPADLPAGPYIWEVEFVSDPSGSMVRGRFQVLAASDARRVRLGPVPPEQAAFSRRLAYALMLESEGLVHDALPLWRALAAERPDEDLLKKWAR